MVTQKQHHSIAGVFVFLLLGLFAVMSMLLVLESAQVYRGIVDETARHNNQRIMRAYMRNALAAADNEGVVQVQEIDGIQTLAISEPPDGEDTYVKYIYCYGGALRELYVSTSYGFHPESGEEICEMNQCDMELKGQLLCVTITDAQGQVYSENIALRTPVGEVSAQ